MDEEEKRLAKVKALRDTKVKRSAQPAAPSSSRCAGGSSGCGSSLQPKRLADSTKQRARSSRGPRSSGACRDCRFGLVLQFRDSRCRQVCIAARNNRRNRFHPADSRSVQRLRRESGADEGTNEPERETNMADETSTARKQHRAARTRSAHPAYTASRTLALAADVAARVRARPARRVVLAAVPADASSSVARRSASSARRRSTRSATAMFVCCRALSRSGARLFRAV